MATETSDLQDVGSPTSLIIGPEVLGRLQILPRNVDISSISMWFFVSQLPLINANVHLRATLYTANGASVVRQDDISCELLLPYYMNEGSTYSTTCSLPSSPPLSGSPGLIIVEAYGAPARVWGHLSTSIEFSAAEDPQ